MAKPAVIRFLNPRSFSSIEDAFVRRFTRPGEDPAHVDRGEGWEPLLAGPPHFILDDATMRIPPQIRGGPHAGRSIYEGMPHGTWLDIESPRAEGVEHGLPRELIIVNTGARCYVSHYSCGPGDTGVMGESHVLHPNSVYEAKILFPGSEGIAITLER